MKTQAYSLKGSSPHSALLAQRPNSEDARYRSERRVEALSQLRTRRDMRGHPAHGPQQVRELSETDPFGDTQSTWKRRVVALQIRKETKPQSRGRPSTVPAPRKAKQNLSFSPRQEARVTTPNRLVTKTLKARTGTRDGQQREARRRRGRPFPAARGGTAAPTAALSVLRDVPAGAPGPGKDARGTQLGKGGGTALPRRSHRIRDSCLRA